MNPQAATLRLAVFPRPGILVDALLVVGGAALVAVCAQISIPLGFTPVPITAQTFAVVLVGASLGAARGAASLALYVAVGMLGAPVYSDQGSGWEHFTGATGGYLVGFIAAAALTGWLADRGWTHRFSTATATMLAGNVVIYAFGLPWLAHSIGTDFEGTLEAGLYPFIFGGILKLYLAAAVFPAAWKLVQRADAAK
jgi:biotin transport system substrate-specific component